jgi:hypothetical protein
MIPSALADILFKSEKLSLLFTLYHDSARFSGHLIKSEKRSLLFTLYHDSARHRRALIQ